MKKVIGFSLALVVVAFGVISMLSLNSCRQRVTTEFDTVYVQSPDWDDSLWVYRQSGTTEDLIISEFLSPQLGFVGGDGGTVLRSIDSGTTWARLATVPVSSESGTGVYGIHFFDATNGLAAGDGYNVWRTNDGGHTWSAIPISTSYNLRCMAFASPTVGILGTADAYSTPPGSNGELWRTSDGGATWNRVLSISTGSFYHIRFLSATYGIALGKFGTSYWTTDAGQTWNRSANDVPQYQITRSTFLNAQTGFACGILQQTDGSADPTGGALLRTDDAGQTWSTISHLQYPVQGIASGAAGILTAAGYAGNVLESTDQGATWPHATLGSARWIDVNYATPQRTIMIGANGHIATRDR
ncbi:MAG: YCF48-related protein [Bacteroidota bacterium]|nr:YCF48-related protein [Bacteroidota bacterium]MDP4232539.1 YCF48-related protein [Bacteroidota bacterium]MDP4241674.1 YCF48-related protein [Bacteroidota bacterium]MDP4286419.1 YCF48-related protein [Bacteroidota bacterium]